MGKIRHVELGDEQAEKDQKKKAEVRRENKKAKKSAEAPTETQVEGAIVMEGEEEKTKKTSTKEKKAHVRSKRYLEIAKLVDRTKLYPLTDAVKLVQKTSMSSFDGTVEIHINLNPNSIDSKSDYRGSVSLPHGSGKKVNVVVADEKIISEIESGKFNFDILVAHPSMMPKLAKVARILGPKGLMPNPKNGTVTPDTEKRVKELSSGQVNFKADSGTPLVHLAVGKVSFTHTQIVENVKAVIASIGTSKITKATMTATMGPGIKLLVA